MLKGIVVITYGLIFICFVIFSYGDEQIKADEELFKAVEKGDINSVKKALKKNANMNAEDTTLMTPLHHAAMHNYKEIAELLISKGAMVDGYYDDYRNFEAGYKTPLFYAAENNSMDVGILLIKKGATVNAHINGGWIPLHTAAWFGKKDFAKLLIDNKAIINASDNEGNTPLYCAVDNNHLEVAALLIESKADVDASLIYSGFTPLYAAIKNSNVEIVRLLLEHKANLYIPGYDGDTPLSCALRIGNEKIVRLIDEYKNTIEIMDDMVWIVNRDGKNEVCPIVTTDDFPFGIPCTYEYSHDHNLLAFIGGEKKDPHLLLVSGSGDIKTIEKGKIDGRTKINWSSNDSMLVFNCENNIWLYQVDNDTLIQLTKPGDYEDIDPAFTSDNKKVRFYRGNRFEFSFSGEEYEVTIDGSDCKKVKGGKKIRGEDLR